MRSHTTRQFAEPAFGRSQTGHARRLRRDATAGFVQQFARFLSVGGVAAATSYGVYMMLVFMHLPTAPARAIGFCVGTLVSFHGNRRHTFAIGETGPWTMLAYAGLYGATLALNVLVNELALHLLASHSVISLTVAYIFATACSSLTNFFGLKFLVFRANPISVRASTDFQAEKDRS